MSKYVDKKTFASMCGINTSRLTQYIKRANVKATNKGLINTKDPLNAEFLLKWSELKAGETPEKRSADVRLKELRAKKIEAETAYKQLQVQRLAGETLPVDQFRILLKQHNVSFINSFKNGAELLVARLSEKAGLSLEDRAQMNGALVEIINDSMKRTIDMTVNSLSSVEKEFSLKRNVGQHD